MSGATSASPAAPSSALITTEASASSSSNLAPAPAPAATPSVASALAPAAAASAALVPAARGTLIDLARAASEKAKKNRKEEAIDGALCSSFQGVEAGGALAAVQSLCDPLDDSSLISARNAFYCEETGLRLKSLGKPPSTALWPGDCEQPPDGYKVLVPGFANQGVQTTLRRQWWLHAGVALTNCIRKGQRMAIARCKITFGTNKNALALFMCAPAQPHPMHT